MKPEQIIQGYNVYLIRHEMSVPGLADKKYPDLTKREVGSKFGGRIIGGDYCDLVFDGYYVDPEEGKTVLVNPRITTSKILFDEDEVHNEADYCLDEAFRTIGMSAIE